MTKATQPDNLPFPPPPAGQRFACVSLDWPSHFETRAPTAVPTANRSPQRHYPTASVEHMMTLPLKDFLAKDAFVFLWMTGPHLVLGTHLRLARAWGLRMSSMVFVWVKTKASFDLDVLHYSPLLEADLHGGTGFTTMANAEYVILLRRGSPRRLNSGIRQIIIAPVGSHSAKPDEFFRRAELYAAGPRLDMFAGKARPGWTRWGFTHREADAA